jgi:hypothetical protein
VTLQLQLPSDTTALRKRLAEVKEKFAWSVFGIDAKLSRLEQTGADHGDYWRQRKLEEIGRELARWEGRG